MLHTVSNSIYGYLKIYLRIGENLDLSRSRPVCRVAALSER
jgi:hypothetical protein